MRDDDECREERDRPGRDRDRGSRSRCPVADRVPDPHRGDRQPDVLLRRERRGRAERERQQPPFVEEPPGEEEQRGRERDRVEVARGQPLHRRVEEVRERQGGGRPFRVEMCTREPEDRQRSGGHRSGLHDEQELRARPDPPQRREQGEDRIEVRAEPRDLLAVDIGDGEEVAVRGRPDGLGHVAEIEAAAAERAVAQHRERPEEGGERGHREPDEPRWRHRATSCSTRPRQRSPSTASLACSR